MIKTLKGHTNTVRSLCEMNNGNLISGSYDQTIKIWNINEEKCLKTIEPKSDFVFALVLLDDMKLACGFENNTIQIWNLNNYSCIQTLTEHIDCPQSGRILGKLLFEYFC